MLVFFLHEDEVGISTEFMLDLENGVMFGFKKGKITCAKLIKCLSNSIADMFYHSHELLINLNTQCAQVKLNAAMWHDNATIIKLLKLPKLFCLKKNSLFFQSSKQANKKVNMQVNKHVSEHVSM